MNAKSPEQTNPEVLRAPVTGVLAAFEPPTLKNNLATLKAIHHCALLDNVLHIELTMPFAWQSGFESLKELLSGELLRVTGAQAVGWKLKRDITTLKRANDQAGVKGVRNIVAVSSSKGPGWEVQYRRQSGASLGGGRRQGGHPGCGHLWPVAPQYAWY